MIKIHDRVKVQARGYLLGDSLVDRMAGGTEGVVTDVKAKANEEYASGFAVTWREKYTLKEHTCCASLLEVV